MDVIQITTMGMKKATMIAAMTTATTMIPTAKIHTIVMAATMIVKMIMSGSTLIF